MGGSGNERGTGKSSGGESGRGRGKGLVCVVYTGDYPDVGKEEILGRVFVSLCGFGFGWGRAAAGGSEGAEVWGLGV